MNEALTGGLPGCLSEFQNVPHRCFLIVSSELYIAVGNSFDPTVVCGYFIWVLSLLFGPCRLLEFTLAGPHEWFIFLFVCFSSGWHILEIQLNLINSNLSCYCLLVFCFYLEVSLDSILEVTWHRFFKGGTSLTWCWGSLHDNFSQSCT